MAKTFKILNSIRVCGRGWVLICKNDEDLICGTKVSVNGNEYIIKGKEQFIKPMDPPIPGKDCGLILSPNDSVSDVKVGDVIEIIK